MKKTRSHSKKGLIILIIITVVLCAVTVLKKQEQPEEYTENKSDYIDSVRPDIDVELLTPNEYSRAGIATNKITGIVIHYTANPGASAMNNRDYFEGLKDSHITKARVILLWVWKVRLFNVYQHGRWRMPQTAGILIRCR